MKRVLIIAFAVLLIDQLIKIWVKTTMYLGEDAMDIGFFRILFVENPGMAFGLSWGGASGKIFLTIFRLLAVAGIGYYIWKQTKKPNVHKGFLTALGLIISGALGNILDSAFYGYIFDSGTTWSESRGVWMDYYQLSQANFEGYAGFMQGCVVDMFQFTVEWPEWVPWYDENGSNLIFGAIFNFADAAISVGVGLIILRQKTFFKKAEQVSSSSEEIKTEALDTHSEIS